MRKLSVCVLFGGMSPEHEISLRSAECLLGNLDTEKYNLFPVGITKKGDWILFTGSDYSMIPSGKWESHPFNRRAAISPVRGQGLLSFEGDCVVRERIDVVFPLLHGENGEDGSVQGLLRLAGIPFVGPEVAASAIAMDKTLTKRIAAFAGITQAPWMMVYREDAQARPEEVLDGLEAKLSYPLFVKPAGGGSSVGVSKAANREELENALSLAGRYDKKLLVEQAIRGREVEVAVMGNDSPVASVCGEIDPGVEFYDYDAKYNTDTSVAYIPARLPEEVAEQVRETAVAAYRAIGCRGMSRVDFFVEEPGNRVILNELNTLPGFTSISMFPKLFAASGIELGELIDQLISLAMED